MPSSFFTICKPTEGQFKDRGSKFLAFAYPISSVDEVKPLLDNLRTEHSSARHVCYAYILGTDGADYRANDDGEPNGTAGLPILNQLKSKELTNVLLAVVRYFGGTKLGVSGLINAYKEAARDALEKVEVIERFETVQFKLRFPHSSIGEVERTLRQHGWTIIHQDFGMDCVWMVEVPVQESELAAVLWRVIPSLTVL